MEERLGRLTGDVAELVKPSSQAGKYVSDEKIAGHLTKVQKALVRFHRQVDAVRLRVDQGLAKVDVAARGASSRSAEYDPAPMQLLISASACGELQPVVSELLKRLEAIGEELSNAGATLWSASHSPPPFSTFPPFFLSFSLGAMLSFSVPFSIQQRC